MAGARGSSRWTCPACGRRVPGEVAECYCGTKQAAAERARSEEAQRRGPAFSPVDVAWQLGLLASVFALGYLWHDRDHPAPPPPPARALTESPRPPAGAPPPANTEMFPTPAPRPTDAPRPTLPLTSPSAPAPSPSVASEVDEQRAEGQRRLEEALDDLRHVLLRLQAANQEFARVCLGLGGEPTSCREGAHDVEEGARRLEDGLQRAEDEARRAWVPPGVVRELRGRAGLEEQACAEAIATARRLHSRYHGVW